MLQKSKSLKLISAFILLIIIVDVFAACAGESTGLSETSANTEVSGISDEETDQLRENTPDRLPADLNFNGREIIIHHRGDDISNQEISAELTGDVVDDVIYYRNQSVEERLNVKISGYKAEGWLQYNTAVSNLRGSIMAGDSTFDIIAGWSARIPSLSLEKLFLNLHEVKYIDMEQPWWVQTLITDLDLGGTLNFLTGDIALTLLDAAYVVYFNKGIQNNYNVTDLYQTVFDKKWTIDKLAEVAKGISTDANGDGVMDENDIFGATWSATNQVDCFLQGSGIKMIKKDSGGMPVLDIEYDKINTIVEKVYDFMFENNGVYSDYGNEMVFGGVQDKMFRSDRCLFFPSALGTATTSLKEMETDYGIIPYPKYDENQKEYYTRIQDSVSLWSIPITNSDPDAAGAVMEAMAAEGYRRVSPVYFEVALKVKYSRDDVSSQMLDIIRDGAYLNFASVYNESIGYPWFVMRALMGTKSKDFASWYAKNEPIIQQNLQKVIDLFQNS